MIPAAITHLSFLYISVTEAKMEDVTSLSLFTGRARLGWATGAQRTTGRWNQRRQGIIQRRPSHRHEDKTKKRWLESAVNAFSMVLYRRSQPTGDGSRLKLESCGRSDVSSLCSGTVTQRYSSFFLSFRVCLQSSEHLLAHRDETRKLCNVFYSLMSLEHDINIWEWMKKKKNKTNESFQGFYIGVPA